MGKAAYTAPQSEMASAVLAVKMERKINMELSNVTLSEPMFIGDSEIVLKMIARNDPAGLPIFYKTRIMEISAPVNHYQLALVPWFAQPCRSADKIWIHTGETELQVLVAG